MTTALRIAAWRFRDIARSRALAVYFVFFLLATTGLLRFAGDPARAIVGLANVVLMVVPLMSLVFGTVFLYAAREFTEVLLAQPISRRTIFAGLYLGLAGALALGAAAGLALPLAVQRGALSQAGPMLALVALAVVLTLVCTAIAFVVALAIEDRLKGLGAAIGLWLVATVLYDAFVLLVAGLLRDQPLERPMLALVLANPVDLARVAFLLQSDAAALMGYTGAVFKRFFGTALGMATASSVLLLWVTLPLAWGARKFDSKDF